jgi:hypothetical protein
MTPAERRALLERYHSALSNERSRHDIDQTSQRFGVVQMPFTDLDRAMHAIRRAHVERTDGKSSPAEADARVKEIIG